MAEALQEEQELLHRLFEQVNEHIETRVEYFALNTAEKMSVVVANMAGAIIVFIFSVLVLFFFSMGFAWWLGDFMNNRAAGFALAGLIFIPIAGLAFWWIRPLVRTKIIEGVLVGTEKKEDQHG